VTTDENGNFTVGIHENASMIEAVFVGDDVRDNLDTHYTESR